MQTADRTLRGTSLFKSTCIFEILRRIDYLITGNHTRHIKVHYIKITYSSVL